jgi:hypothetical protein
MGVLPNGLEKDGFDTIKLGTPMGRVFMVNAKLKLAIISVQIDFRLLSISIDSDVFRPGKVESD